MKPVIHAAFLQSFSTKEQESISSEYFRHSSSRVYRASNRGKNMNRIEQTKQSET